MGWILSDRPIGRRALGWLAMLAGVIATASLLQYAGPKPTLPQVVYRNPHPLLQPFMEGIYWADHALTAPTKKISAAIVPHHLTASATMAAGIKMLERQQPTSILLLSPDHFHRCPTLLCTVNSAYRTEFGTVEASTDVVASLITSPLVTQSPALFTQEHGISAVVPFIAHYLPKLRVTPLVISTASSWRQQAPELLALLSQVLNDDVLLIVSSDFSHYLPLDQAEAMDAKTAAVLLEANVDGIAQLQNPQQSDCPGCLWVLAALANDRGFTHPQVVRHTNSATILKSPDVQSTTSHLSIVWYAQVLGDQR